MSYPRATLNNFLFLAQLFIPSGERTSTAKLMDMVVLFPEEELEKDTKSSQKRSYYSVWESLSCLRCLPAGCEGISQ